MGSPSYVEGQMRMYLPMRGHVYSSGLFFRKPSNPQVHGISAPKMWGLEPRTSVHFVEGETSVIDADAAMFRTMAHISNRAPLCIEKLVTPVIWRDNSHLDQDERTIGLHGRSQGSATVEQV